MAIRIFYFLSGFGALANAALAVTTAEYNALVDKYQSKINDERVLTEQYNEIIKKYNALVIQENQHRKDLRALESKYKRLIRDLKMPACKPARNTLKQCAPEIFKSNKKQIGRSQNWAV